MARPERLDLDGEALLGIPAGSRHNQFSLAQLGAVTQSDGWIVSDGAAGSPPTIQVWRFSGYRHHGAQVYVVGPWVGGVTLDEALAEPPSPIRGQRLQRLATALKALSERVDFGGPLQGDAVVFTEDGSLLLLPPAVMDRLNGVKSPAERLAHVERYLHPHRQGPDQLAFALGVAVYRILCGRYPFRRGFRGSDPRPRARVPGGLTTSLSAVGAGRAVRHRDGFPGPGIAGRAHPCLVGPAARR